MTEMYGGNTPIVPEETIEEWSKLYGLKTEPTDTEILELSTEIEEAGLGQIDLVRAALERWGR